MSKRVGFSGSHESISEIFQEHSDTEQAIRQYFANPPNIQRFLGLTKIELAEEMKNCILSLEQSSSLRLFAALEAAFRIDYLKRVYDKQKDSLSRDFRNLHKEVGTRASLEEQILKLWGQNTSISAQTLGDIKAAFKYRHWLAHGQYWTPKFGQNYDYNIVAALAQAIFSDFPFYG